MSQLMNRCYRLRRRPQGSLTAGDLEFVEEAVPEIQDGQALIRALWLSVDPANRIWMSEIHYHLPPVALGSVMRGIGIGQVIQSRRDDMALRLKYEPGPIATGRQIITRVGAPEVALAAMLAAVPADGTLVVLATYTSLLAIRMTLERRGLVPAIPR